MTESTLSMNYTKLISIIGRYLGYGSDSSKWTAGMLETIYDVLDSGIRQWYNPPPLPGQLTSYTWSFLQPTTTLELVAGTADYNLPDNFGGLVGRFTFGPGDGYYNVVSASEYEIRNLRQIYTNSDRPQRVAVTPVITAGQPIRWKAMFWPTPSSAHTLTYKYNVILDAVRTANPNPLGGAPHAETIKQSCLAIAEQHKNEERGVQTQLFFENLAKSIDYDQKVSTPDYFGSNTGGRREGVSVPGRSTKLFYNETQILGGS